MPTRMPLNRRLRISRRSTPTTCRASRMNATPCCARQLPAPRSAKRRSAASIRAAAEADIAQERKKAVNDLKNEIGGMAVEIAGKVVEREINESDHQALIDEFIRNVGDAS